jgi:alpha-glucosidase
MKHVSAGGARWLTSAVALLAILVVVRPAPGAEERFIAQPTVAADRLADGVALFVPEGLSPDHLPPSLSFLTPLHAEGRLPSGWQLRPRFSRSDHHHRVTLTVPAGTSLYGTGEVTGPLMRNRQTITLWNTDTFGWQIDGGRRLYQSHPWVLGVRADGSAFGLIADSTWRAEMNLTSGIEFTSDGPAFPVVIIDRSSPEEVLHELAMLTGTMPLPPRWALGYQQCRYSYHPDSKVREIADQLRSRQIPCDVIWMDIHYMDGYRVFTFNPKEFPDPRGLDDYLHQRGFKSVWMIDPGVKAQPGYKVYDSGTAADVWVHDAKGGDYQGDVWPGACVFPDFTRPQTRQWWSSLYGEFMGQGVDGVWNDMNEPAVMNVPSKTMPLDNWHRGGEELPAGPHAEYHNVFGMLMVKATRAGVLAANPDKRPFVLTRANFLGGQRYAATWTGDNESTWEDLKMSVPMSLNLSLSGQPFNGPDLGGFGGAATPDLWGQWVAFGVFFPFCRGHAVDGSPPKEPWAFGPEIERVARTALQRRYRLLPYLYTQFYDSSVTGLPIMRPLFFADVRDAALRAEDQAFLTGPDLLVVPKWAKHPHLPRGDWRTISLVGEDSSTDRYQADLRIREGAIIPLGKVVQNTTEESLDPLTLMISLDRHGRAEGQLYEDAGDGFGYRTGEYLLTKYQAEQGGRTVSVRVAQTTGHRVRAQRPVAIELLTDHGVVRASGTDGQPIEIRLP